MPFLSGGQSQRGIDQRHNLSREIWRAAVAHPLRITTVDHEARCLESRHVPGHPGLAGAELPHQFANTMLSSVPHHSKGFETGRFRECRQNNYWIHILNH